MMRFTSSYRVSQKSCSDLITLEKRCNLGYGTGYGFLVFRGVRKSSGAATAQLLLNVIFQELQINNTKLSNSLLITVQKLKTVICYLNFVTVSRRELTVSRRELKSKLISLCETCCKIPKLQTCTVLFGQHVHLTFHFVDQVKFGLDCS